MRRPGVRSDGPGDMSRTASGLAVRRGPTRATIAIFQPSLPQPRSPVEDNRDRRRRGFPAAGAFKTGNQKPLPVGRDGKRMIGAPRMPEVEISGVEQFARVTVLERRSRGVNPYRNDLPQRTGPM